MPTSALPPCRVPGCPSIGPCAEHSETRRQRDPWRAWYHIARWRHPVFGMRAQVLSDEPFCVACRPRLVLAVDVDHIEPHRGDPALFWLRSNLQGLCKFHHGEKSGQEK